MGREERKARRALRREKRKGNRAERKARREARRETLADYLTPLIQAAEVLIVGGAEKLEWVVDQFTDLIDIPMVDEDELDEVIEAAIEVIVAKLFPK